MATAATARRRPAGPGRADGEAAPTATPTAPPPTPTHADGRRLRRRADRRPQLRHRPVLDPAVPAPDLPGLRNPVRDPVAGARVDQPDRDGLRHQPQRLHRRRPGLDAVHPLDLGDVRGRRQQRRAQGSLQPGRRDLRRRPLPQRRRRRGGPAHRDLRLQPRRLVRRRGPALRQPVRQAARRPRRLAHRPDRGRPLPGRRRLPLRRRHLRARGRASARSRRKGVAGNAADVVSSSPTRRGINIYSREGAPVVAVNDGVIKEIGESQEARPLRRPPGRLRQPLHLRRARRGLRGLPGAEGDGAHRRGLPSGRRPATTPSPQPGQRQLAGRRRRQRSSPTGRRARRARQRRRGRAGRVRPVNTEDLRERLYAFPERPENVGRADVTGQLDELLASRFPGYESFKSYLGGS